MKAKKYADKIVKREMAQGKDEHSLPSIAAAMVLKLRTAKKARFTIRRVRFLLKTDSSPPWAIYKRSNTVGCSGCSRGSDAIGYLTSSRGSNTLGVAVFL